MLEEEKSEVVKERDELTSYNAQLLDQLHELE